MAVMAVAVADGSDGSGSGKPWQCGSGKQMTVAVTSSRQLAVASHDRVAVSSSWQCQAAGSAKQRQTADGVAVTSS
jgi:hypothetical protein